MSLIDASYCCTDLGGVITRLKAYFKFSQDPGFGKRLCTTTIKGHVLL